MSKIKPNVTNINAADQNVGTLIEAVMVGNIDQVKI